MHQQILILLVSILVVNSAIIGPISLENGKQRILKSTSDSDWWETAAFYHIFPRSFQDSDGDGVGDIQGVIQRLDHLKDAGITGTWLSPIFKSPQVDQGFDISDYFDIDPIFGTLADFKELLEKAKELGIKVILDLVPNHTSDQHEWFKKSVAKTEGYEDFYVWHDGKTVDGIRQPPNNWISNYKGSAWKWNEERQQYYYHTFAPEEPDLNYYNPLVVAAMKDVLRYWLAFGVDGFKIDAVPYLFEDPQFRDEPLAPGYTEYDVNEFDSLIHVYTKDLNENVGVVYQFRAVVDEYNKNNTDGTRILVTEADSPIDTLRLYLSSRDGVVPGVHFTLNLNFVTKLTTPFTRDDVFDNIYPWIMGMDHESSNWVLGNDNNHRLATRLGKENIDGFNMLAAILPGIMVTYYGDEIGMENGEVTCEQGYDPKAIKDCTTFTEVSRDFERTPFQWDDSENGGFTTGTPWLPVSNKTAKVNLVAENIPTLSSHYNIYKNLISFRKNFLRSTWLNGVGVQKVSQNVLRVDRHIDEYTYNFFFNTGSTMEFVDLRETNATYTILISSINSLYATGNPVHGLILDPHESVLMRKIQ